MGELRLDVEKQLAKAIKHYWTTRGRQQLAQGGKTGKKDAGSRSAVTGGKPRKGCRVCRYQVMTSKRLLGLLHLPDDNLARPD